MWLDLLVGFEARIALLYFALGALSFVPHMLIGLDARESAPPGAAETAGGFVKAIGQVGGALAGAPLVLCVQTIGAWAYVPSLVLAPASAAAAALLALVAALPEGNMPRSQPQSREKEKCE
jgi:sugar phosphate permease